MSRIAGVAMKPFPQLKPEELKEAIAYWRRFYDRVWLVIAAGFLLAFTVAWGFTSNREHLYSGLFAAGLCLIGLIYSHCVVFSPYRDPVETKKRLERLSAKQRSHVRSVGIFNGTMMLLFSPFLFLIAVTGGAEQYGWHWALGGGLVAFLWTAGSAALVAWSRRRKP